MIRPPMVAGQAGWYPSEAPGAFFDRMIEILQPDGKGLLGMIEAYFDESERDTGFFAVAGYGFVPDHAREFDREWREILGPIRAFHATDVANFKDEFKDFTPKTRDALVIRAVEIVTKHIEVAVGFSCRRADFESGAINLRGLREPYSYFCHLCMQEIGNWMRAQHIDGDVAYFFDQGNFFKKEASALMNLAINLPEVGELYRRRSHIFARSDDVTPLQAADLLVWEWTKYQDDTVDQKIRPLRKSLEALFDSRKYRMRHLSAESLSKLYEPMRQLQALEGIEGEWPKLLSQPPDIP